MEIPFFDACSQIKYFRMGVRGNNLVDDIVFVVNRKTCDGLDLTPFVPYVKLENRKDNYFDKDGRVELISGAADDKIKLKYKLGRKTTMHAFVDVQLQFEQSTGDDVIVWQTEPVNITFSRTIPADAEIANQHPTILQDYDRRLKRIENIKIINGGKP